MILLSWLIAQASESQDLLDFKRQPSAGFGEHEVVTDENKHHFVSLAVHFKTTEAIFNQLQSFLQGFHSVIPAKLISIFSPDELRRLICGESYIDIEDLRLNTAYEEYERDDQCILWFWLCLNEFDESRKEALIRFVTGTSKV